MKYMKGWVKNNARFKFISNNKCISNANGTGRNDRRRKKIRRKKIKRIITTKKQKLNWLYKKYRINYWGNEKRRKKNFRAKKDIRK